MAATRREDRVVLEVGSRVCRAGFGGECAPRVLLDAAAAGARTLGRPLDALYAPDQMLAAHPRQLQERHRDLVRCLVRLLRTVYQEYVHNSHRHLVCDARAYKVLLVHSPLWVEAVQDALCGVLLGNLGVPSVSFIDTHTLALLATGRNTGLVVDCGYWETTVMPVYAGRPLRNALTTTPRAGRRLRACVAALCTAYASVRGAPPADVPRAAVERITTEALYVHPAPRAACDASLPLDTAAMHAAYAEDAEDFDLRTDAGTLRVPGWIRSAACEALFDDGDEDEAGVVQCARQSIAQLPLDTRREILDAVLLAGGTAMLPGFAARFEAQLTHGAAPTPRIQVLNAGRPGALRMPPTPPNLLAWTGGSLAAGVGAHGIEQVSSAAWRVER